MRTRALLISSLGLNVLLAGLWLAGRGQRTPSFTEPEVAVSAPPEVLTNVVVRRQFFSWAELESDDYEQYIENLRSIDCPEQTIRDVIIADVNQLFEERRKLSALPTGRQWWQGRADPGVLQEAESQLAALEQERRSLLEHLLGPDWNRSALDGIIVALKVPLDGPTLGNLPPETQAAVQAASGRAQSQFEHILKTDPASPDPAALAALERQLRSELSPVLTSAQLEEFMFRYSPTAQRLRSELGSVALFNPTPTEIRTLFRDAQSIELQLMSLKGEGFAVDSQREGLLRELQIAFQNSLGPARYKEFLRLQDPVYQQAIAAAQAAGVSSATDLFYAVDRLGSIEQEGINQDTNLTPLQKEIATRQLELEQLQVAAEAVGQAPEAEPPSPPQRTYSFQKGDSIAEVSMRTGVPVALILRANPTLRPEQIPIGTQIVIPDRTAPLQ